jgi:hypothetical protein
VSPDHGRVIRDLRRPRRRLDGQESAEVVQIGRKHQHVAEHGADLDAVDQRDPHLRQRASHGNIVGDIAVVGQADHADPGRQARIHVFLMRDV